MRSTSRFSDRIGRARSLGSSERPIVYFDVVHDYPTIGGIVEFSQTLFRELKARYGQRLISARDAASRLGAPDASQMPYIDRERHIAELLAVRHPDSIFFFPNFQSPVARAPGVSGPRIINVVHDVQFDALPELFSAGRLRWLDRAFSETRENADQVVFISEAARAHYIGRFGAPRQHSVIYNPIAVDTSAKTSLDDGSPFLLSSFHHYPHKNFSGLLSLFAKLAERDAALKLVVTGHGGEKFAQDLAQLPSDVQARVRHLGYVPRGELDGLYRRAWAFVTLSRFEGFNMSAAEAARHGVPLILSDLPVHRELFSQNACFVDPMAPCADTVATYLAERTHAGAAWPLEKVCEPAYAARAYADVIDAASQALHTEILLRANPSRARFAMPALPSGEVIARVLLTTTMLVGAASLAVHALSLAAFAEGGTGGGQVGKSGVLVGVPGGSGYMGANGDDGATGSPYFGGGGGGAGGGDGGLGDIYNCSVLTCSVPGTGGAGGTALNPDGDDGVTPNYAGGGGGGGGGFHGNGFSGSFGGVNLTGGQGGDGGDGGPSGPGAGGGGGAGGFGAVITGAGSFDNALAITGGDGGDGGASPAFRFIGGGGGDGGVGAYFVDPGASFTTSGIIFGGDGGDGGQAGGNTAIGGSGGAGGAGIVGHGITLNINGLVRGGDGGIGGLGTGTGGLNGSSGSGGSGISGSNLTIVTGGQIAGGISGSGVRGNALTFTGGSNTLTFKNATSGMTGDIAVVGMGTTLTFLQNNGVDVVINNAVTGDGSIIKDGANAVVLAGNNTFTGTMTILSGTLSVSGTLPGTTYFENGSILKGTGTMSNVTFRSGGIHAPGNSIGTQTILGAYVLGPGATLEIETDAAGNSDKVVVLGTVDLTGSLLRVLAENGAYGPSTSYVIIENDGNDAVVGTFADITSNLAFLFPSVTYTGGDGNDVVLTLSRNALTFASVARTRNQRAIAPVIEARGAGDAIHNAIVALDANGARQAFDALSGDAHASVRGMLAQDSRFVRDTIFARLGQASRRGAPMGAGAPIVASAQAPAGRMALGGTNRDPGAGAGPDGALAFWTQGYGTWGDSDSDGNAAGFDRRVGGFLSGVDAMLSGGWRLGVATGYSQGSMAVGARRTSTDVDSYHLAAYTSGWIGGLSLRAGASWSWHDIDTARTVVIPGFVDRLSASYDGSTGQIFGEVALPMRSGAIAFEPFAGIAWVQAGTDAFRETGGLAALAAGSRDEDTGFSTIGVRTATQVQLGGLQVVPSLSLAWQHAFSDVLPISTFAFASGGGAFSIAGVPLARDSALIEAGLEVLHSADATFGISYQGRLGDDTTDHGLSGRVNWRF